MGHIINPITQRLSYSRFWNSNWAASTANRNTVYSFISVENSQLMKYIKGLFSSFLRRLFYKGWLILNLQILRFWNSILFILTSQIKFIVFLYKNLYRILNTMFSYKKYEFKKNTYLSTHHNIKQIRQRRFLHVTGAWPYVRKKRYNLSNLKFLHKRKDINKDWRWYIFDFLRNLKKTPRYNSNTTALDFTAYPWRQITALFKIRRRGFHKILTKPKIILHLLKYLIVTRWVKQIRNLLFILLQRLCLTSVNIDLVLVNYTIFSLTANFVAKYLSIRLLQKFSVKRLMTLMTRQLTKAQDNALIWGFKVAFNGRFARRGRALHSWKRLGKLPNSNTNVFVDYAMMLPVLTNSICAVKVWITRPLDVSKLFIL